MKKLSFLVNTSTILLLSIALCSSPLKSFSQEEVQEEQPAPEDEGKKPVRSPWEGTLLIDNQTIKVVPKGGREIMIHHRFGTFQNGLSDLYGIYAPSNIRLGILYGVTSRLSIGFGTEKNNKMQEFQLKYAILHQTRDNSIPIAITYFGNMVIDGNNKEKFGETYKFLHRFSYFNELLIGRKFNERLSLQLGANFSHFNAVDSLYDHDQAGLTFGGRFKLWGDNSFIFEYDKPLRIKSLSEYLEPKNSPTDNFSFGIEFGTSTHCFQIFAANWDKIIAQKNYMFATNKFFNKGILLGFNITVRI